MKKAALLFSLLLIPAVISAQDTWDVSNPDLGETTSLTFTTDEGTWMWVRMVRKLYSTFLVISILCQFLVELPPLYVRDMPLRFRQRGFIVLASRITNH